MSLRSDLAATLDPMDGVSRWVLGRTMRHGEEASFVKVWLEDGWTLEGTFTTEAREGFGGVVFASQKDIPALMAAKVRSVLAGTAEGQFDLQDTTSDRSHR